MCIIYPQRADTSVCKRRKQEGIMAKNDYTQKQTNKNNSENTQKNQSKNSTKESTSDCKDKNNQ